MFCRIDVADTGIGISEAEQAKVFSRFYRSPSVSEQDGVGIGLYLTRHILAGQGGYIKVASSLGGGSVFSMFLPRKT
ncbi:MAG: sensor histidine kinase [Agathobaculum sp.]|uniref:sensor histidine kinase n=1 Tax=Agathobaculum sp. TaxID=2048138 RepID=UPI003D8F972A